MNISQIGKIIVPVLIFSCTLAVHARYQSQDQPPHAQLNEYQTFLEKEGLLPATNLKDEKRTAAQTIERMFKGRTLAIEQASGRKQEEQEVVPVHVLIDVYKGARLLLEVFTLTDSQLGVATSKEWKLSDDQIKGVLLNVLSALSTAVFTDHKNIDQKQMVDLIATYLVDKKLLPDFGIKISTAARLSGALLQLRMKLLGIDVYGIDYLPRPSKGKQPNPFAVFHDKLTSLIDEYLSIMQEYQATMVEKREIDQNFIDQINDLSTRFIDEGAAALASVPKVEPFLGLLKKHKYQTAFLVEFLKQPAPEMGGMLVFSLYVLARKLQTIKTELEQQQQKKEVKETRKVESEKRYEKAREFGTDVVRTTISHKFADQQKLESYKQLTEYAQGVHELDETLDRYQQLVQNYIDTGTLNEQELGELNQIDLNLKTEQDQARNKAGQVWFFSKGEKTKLEDRSKQLGSMRDLVTDVRRRLTLGEKVLSEQDEGVFVEKVVRRALDQFAEIFEKNPDIVNGLSDITSRLGSVGTEQASWRNLLSGLSGKVKNPLSLMTYVPNLLDIWNDVKRSKTLSTLIGGLYPLMQDPAPVQRFYAALVGKKAVETTPAEVMAWRKGIKEKLGVISRAPFVSGAGEMMSRVDRVTTFGTLDYGYRLFDESLQNFYHTSLISAWRQIDELRTENNKLKTAQTVTVTPTPQAVVPTTTSFEPRESEQVVTTPATPAVKQVGPRKLFRKW